MTVIDLDGHTIFHDRNERRELANRMAVVIDLDTAVVLVGTPGDRHGEELVFDDVAVRRALARVVEALRRHSYRRRAVQPVPKPESRSRCDFCGGRRTRGSGSSAGSCRWSGTGGTSTARWKRWTR